MRVRAWLTKKNISPNVLFSILIVLLVGLIFGIFATGQYQKTELMITYNPSSKTKQFLITFTQNYWYFFLLWLSALIPFGFVLAYFILFYKGFILGVTLGLIIKAEALFGTYSFFKLIIWQLFILMPLLVFLAQRVLVISFTVIPRKGIKSKPQLNMNTFVNTLLIITLGLVIYSVLIAIGSVTVSTT